MKEKTIKKDFVLEIIHDIKAPILSIDYALKDKKRDALLDEIYKINKHNLNYVENLISGYSIEKGKYCPKFELVNILEIIQEELKTLESIIKIKNLRIIISKDKINTPIIKGDRYLLKQIILNLISNAVKYTQNCGKIEIITENKKGCLDICFKNSIQEKDNIFSSSKLGLEIINKKTKLMGGKFKITNEGEKICFNLTFKTD